jgi:hypothetical protein
VSINKLINNSLKNKTLRLLTVLIAAATLTGCAYWWRAYQTYQQMGEFDKYFTVATGEDFSLNFKQPIMLSEDFVSLARLRPTEENPKPEGKHWRYWFRKVDGYKKVIKPEINFYSDLNFNKQDKLEKWSFSSLFLDIAPPKFLEASIRSIGGGEINEGKMQLRGNTDAIQKIAAELPKKPAVVARLGDPFEIKKDRENEIYIYRFMLDTKTIDEGFEDRALSEVKLSFNKKSQELVKMAGRFAGLKISINYKKFQENQNEES